MPITVLSTQTIGRILEGGASVCRATGIPVAGGHNIDSAKSHSQPSGLGLGLGLGATAANQAQCRRLPGDLLVLGKPLGVGVLSAALTKG